MKTLRELTTKQKVVGAVAIAAAVGAFLLYIKPGPEEEIIEHEEEAKKES